MEVNLAQDEGSPRRLFIDTDRQLALADGQPLALLPTEFRILQLLASTPGRTFSRQEILDGINDQDYAVTERAVDVQITHLRKKLGPLAHWIETVRGQGYCFQDRSATSRDGEHPIQVSSGGYNQAVSV